jgi:cytoskeletal protein CcmA (bactofilin family)
MTIWAPFALTFATGTLVALPLTPALRELRRQRDAKPIATRVDDGRIDNFADALREYMVPLQSIAADPRGTMMHKRMRDGAPGFVISRESAFSAPTEPIDATVYSAESLIFPYPVCVLREFYVRGDVELAPASFLRTLLAEGSVTLGERSSVARWIHAADTLYAKPGCRLLGRASAGQGLTLGAGCQFYRLQAPSVCAGAQDVLTSRNVRLPDAYRMSYPRPGRVRSDGDFQLRDSDVFHGHVISTRAVSIGENVVVIGSVKARRRVDVGSGSAIQGALISQGPVVLGRRCFLKGPVLSEQEIVIRAGTYIGTPESPTSVSAPRISVELGSVIYGSVWARQRGEVRS